MMKLAPGRLRRRTKARRAMPLKPPGVMQSLSAMRIVYTWSSFFTEKLPVTLLL
jgi:hypothetical protein